MTTDPETLTEQIRQAIRLTPHQRGQLSRIGHPDVREAAKTDTQVAAVLSVIHKAQAEAWEEGTEAVDFDMEVRGFLRIPDDNPYRGDTDEH